MGAVGEDHIGFDLRAVRYQFFHQRHEVEIEAQNPVFGVIDDVGDLIREEARVDGVADRPDARNTEIEFQMAIGVPRQRSYPVPQSNAEIGQRVGELANTAIGIGIGVAVNIAFAATADDFLPPVPARGVLQQRRDQKRTIHHGTLHYGPSPLRYG